MHNNLNQETKADSRTNQTDKNPNNIRSRKSNHRTNQRCKNKNSGTRNPNNCESNGRERRNTTSKKRLVEEIQRNNGHGKIHLFFYSEWEEIRHKNNRKGGF